MATICRSSDGDILDSLCQAHYGHLLGCVEAVFAANPGLAEESQPLRAGVLIVLPDLPVAELGDIQLWE